MIDRGRRMRIEIDSPDTVSRSGELRLRAVLLNDSFEPVAVFRNAFLGPTLRGDEPGPPRVESVEATFGEPEEPLILQPFTFYGRERSVSDLAPGDATVVASYRGPGGEELSASKPLRVRSG